MSRETIKIIAGILATESRDKVVMSIGDSLRKAFKDERISEVRVERILGKFIEELKKA